MTTHLQVYLSNCQNKYTPQEQDNLINKYIVSTPHTCSGDPRIDGTRICVNQVINSIIYDTFNDFLDDYHDYITNEMIEACVLFHHK